jgi:large subunit ribosomal protein L13
MKITNRDPSPTQVKLSGKKWSDKIYRWHTGYPGGLKERPAKDMLERKPTFIIRKAILGMLYRNNLRKSYMEPRLKIYAGPDHPHTIQLPMGTEASIKVPRKLTGDFHYGLKKYSETSFQQYGTKGIA